jgi:hypothetical protein
MGPRFTWEVNIKFDLKEISSYELCVIGGQPIIQGDSNMTRTDLCVNTIKSVPVIFEPPCISKYSFISKCQHDITDYFWCVNFIAS